MRYTLRLALTPTVMLVLLRTPNRARHLVVAAERVAPVDVRDGVVVGRRRRVERPRLAPDVAAHDLVAPAHRAFPRPGGLGRVEGLAVAEAAVRSFGDAGGAVEDHAGRERGLDAAARDARHGVAAAERVRVLPHLEGGEERLVRAEEVLFAGLEEEVLEPPAGEAVVRVEAQAPDVLGDDEELDAIGRAAHDRRHQHQRDLARVAEVARGLVDEGLVVELAGREQDLALDHVGLRGDVEPVDEAEEDLRDEVALLEDLEGDDGDALDDLPRRARVDLALHALEGVLERGALVARRRAFTSGCGAGSSAKRARSRAAARSRSSPRSPAASGSR